MTSVAAQQPSDSLKWPLSLAIAAHGVLLVFLVVGGIVSHRGQDWGGPGGSITVGVVGSVPAIPLPHPEMETASRVVDDSKGLYNAEPPKIETPPPDALPIPKFKELKPPRKPVSRPSRI